MLKPPFPQKINSFFFVYRFMLLQIHIVRLFDFLAKWFSLLHHLMHRRLIDWLINWFLQEFHPYLYKQHSDSSILEFPSFNSACDTFFSQVFRVNYRGVYFIEITPLLEIICSPVIFWFITFCIIHFEKVLFAKLEKINDFKG